MRPSTSQQPISHAVVGSAAAGCHDGGVAGVREGRTPTRQRAGGGRGAADGVIWFPIVADEEVAPYRRHAHRRHAGRRQGGPAAPGRRACRFLLLTVGRPLLVVAARQLAAFFVVLGVLHPSSTALCCAVPAALAAAWWCCYCRPATTARATHRQPPQQQALGALLLFTPAYLLLHPEQSLAMRCCRRSLP